MIERKIEDIRSHFAAVVGACIIRYETAELLHHDSIWDHWADLPIRLYIGSDRLIAIAWSKSDDLWIAKDLSLPFSIEGSTTRWTENRFEKINAAIGSPIRSVSLGRGELSIDGRDVEIWTRVLIQLDRGWLEVFNAGDENGYDFHTERPAGSFITCV